MFLGYGHTAGVTEGLPHRRGDVSRPHYHAIVFGLSSPRAWGCFYISARMRAPSSVFPTGVGMFPALARFMIICLPHGRGDVSLQPAAKVFESAFSPRMWGCF